MRLIRHAANIDDYRIEDFEVEGYSPHAVIKADVRGLMVVISRTSNRSTKLFMYEFLRPRVRVFVKTRRRSALLKVSLLRLAHSGRPSPSSRHDWERFVSSQLTA